MSSNSITFNTQPIPKEVWHVIFSNLDVTGVLEVSQVCKVWKEISDDQNIWESLAAWKKIPLTREERNDSLKVPIKMQVMQHFVFCWEGMLRVFKICEFDREALEPLVQQCKHVHPATLQREMDKIVLDSIEKLNTDRTNHCITSTLLDVEKQCSVTQWIGSLYFWIGIGVVYNECVISSQVNLLFICFLSYMPPSSLDNCSAIMPYLSSFVTQPKWQSVNHLIRSYVRNTDPKNSQTTELNFPDCLLFLIKKLNNDDYRKLINKIYYTQNYGIGPDQHYEDSLLRWIASRKLTQKIIAYLHTIRSSQN
jgi:hypothetical protein